MDRNDGITAFKIFDKPFKSSADLMREDKIEISYNDQFISFEFAALDFTNPQKNKYAYMLEGFDKDWIYSASRRYASYTNLDRGDYIFKVKASNNDGIWNEEGRSIKLIITPPFWRTWWAYFIYAALFIFILYSLRKYELNKGKQKEEERIRIEREGLN